MGLSRSRLPGRRLMLALTTAMVVFGLAAGIITGAFTSLAHGGLYATGLWSRSGASTVPPGTFDTPAPPATTTPAPTAGLPSPVLAVAKPSPGADPTRVVAQLNGVDPAAMQGTFGGTVIDLGTGAVLYGNRARRPYIPASTVKLLTSAAALSVLGPEHRFTTTTVAGGKGKIVLVGGGDPYLASKPSASSYPTRASLVDLAQRTAATLQRSKQRTVALGYDASLFSGPTWHSNWPGGYADQVTPVSALWVDEGRVRGVSPGPRVSEPAKNAADAFARALKAQGITVTSVTPAKAATGARVLGAVKSMPLERIVEQLLLASDNDAAEVVFRHTALGAQRPGSFAEARLVVQARLRALGVWIDGTAIPDGSGLSRETRVSADTLARVLRLAAEETHPELRAVITGLPVAGVEGTLQTRFFDGASVAGRGLVRGKTGTLSKVHALAGLVRTRDGSVLIYAFLVNDAENEYAARVWLDRVSTALSACGCRKK